MNWLAQRDLERLDKAEYNFPARLRAARFDAVQVTCRDTGVKRQAHLANASNRTPTTQ